MAGELVVISHIELAAAKRAIEDVMAEYPTVSGTGFGISNFNRHSTRNECLKLLAVERDYLLTEEAECQVATATAFLQQCVLTVTPRENSYHLKHVAEGWGRRHGYMPYVSNGALIVAALAGGVVVKPFDREAADINARVGSYSPNAAVGVSKRSVDRISKENNQR